MPKTTVLREPGGQVRPMPIECAACGAKIGDLYEGEGNLTVRCWKCGEVQRMSMSVHTVKDEKMEVVNLREPGGSSCAESPDYWTRPDIT